MGTYKGNVGNLMQHWTLCELLTVASKHINRLNYIDAYAMAPWATHCPGPTREFLCVRNGLPGQESAYERAWHNIARRHPTVGYPSSAAFVHEIWNGPHSLLLCENDVPTANEIQTWLDTIQPSSGCEDPMLLRGDWQDNLFLDPLPNPRDADPPDDSLTFISLDPDRYERDPVGLNRRNLYPRDLQRILGALESAGGGVLLQISTYSRGNKNQDPQGAVVSSANSILTRGGFTLGALVWCNGDMMSLVYVRGVAWAPMLAGLPQQFDNWHQACR